MLNSRIIGFLCCALLAITLVGCDGGAVAVTDAVGGESVESGFEEPQGPLFGENESAYETMTCEQLANERVLLINEKEAITGAFEKSRSEAASACVSKSCSSEDACAWLVERIERGAKRDYAECVVSYEKKWAELLELRGEGESKRVQIDLIIQTASNTISHAWDHDYDHIYGVQSARFEADSRCGGAITAVNQDETLTDFFNLPPELTKRNLLEIPQPDSQVINVDCSRDLPDVPTDVLDEVDRGDDKGECPDLVSEVAQLHASIEALQGAIENMKSQKKSCEDEYSNACGKSTSMCNDIHAWKAELENKLSECTDGLGEIKESISTIKDVYAAWSSEGKVYNRYSEAGDVCRDAADDMLKWIDRRRFSLPPASLSTQADLPLGMIKKSDADYSELLCEDDQVAVGVYGNAGGDIDAMGVICQSWQPGRGLYGIATLSEKHGGDGGENFRLQCPAGFALHSIYGTRGWAYKHPRQRVVGALAAKCVRLGERGIELIGRSMPYHMYINERMSDIPNLKVIGDFGDGDEFVGTRPSSDYMRGELLNAFDWNGCGREGVARGIYLRTGAMVEKVGLFCSDVKNDGSGIQLNNALPHKWTANTQLFAEGYYLSKYVGNHPSDEVLNFIGHEVDDDAGEGIDAEEMAESLIEKNFSGNDVLVMTGIAFSFYHEQLDFIKPLFKNVRYVYEGGFLSGYSPENEKGINNDAGTLDEVKTMRCPRGYVVTGMVGTEHIGRIGIRCSPIVEGGKVDIRKSMWSNTGIVPANKTEILSCGGIDDDGLSSMVAIGLKGTSDNVVQQLKLKCARLRSVAN